LGLRDGKYIVFTITTKNPIYFETGIGNLHRVKINDYELVFHRKIYHE